MPPNNGHHSKGKGKGKGKEPDLAENFGQLDLGEHPDARVPRSGQYVSDQSSYSKGGQYTSDNDGYTYAAPDPAYSVGYEGYQTAFPPTTRDSATNGGASSSGSGYPPPGYASSGYAPSGYTPSGYAPSGYAPSGYSPSGYASSSYASSYTPSSCAASSCAPSQASSNLSSAPPKYETGGVNNHIAQQQPARNRYELPCEFHLLTGCSSRFQGGEEREWKEHHEVHLRDKFPTKLKCWFCDTFIFDSNDTYCGGDKRYNFDRRMDHIRGHIMDDGYGTSHMRPDGALIRHLRHERLINNQTYNEILDRVNPTAAPPIPVSRPGTLAQVVEEPASASNDRRQEKKNKHESSRRRHKK